MKPDAGCPVVGRVVERVVDTVVPARFELRSGESWRDPFPMYAALRRNDPASGC